MATNELSLIQIIIGVILGIMVALTAWKAGALSGSGAIAAAIEGGIIFGIGGLKWAILLLTFFITSSVLSFAFKRRKLGVIEKFSKSSRRDAWQVLANGGVSAVWVSIHAFLPASGWTWAGFAASLAAVNADTWATELGTLSTVLPRSITSGEPVPMGTSGGITFLGTLAALAGSGLIGFMAACFEGSDKIILSGSLLTIAGLAGALVDSLLGATLQAIYYCPVCQKETERHPIHTCGTATRQIHGLTWMNNDFVNLACALFGTTIGLILWFIFI